MKCFQILKILIDLSLFYLGKANGVKRKDWDCRSVGIEIERKVQHLSLQVPLRSHSSSSSSEENSSSSAALPLLAGEKESPSSTEDHMGQKEFLSGAKREDGHGRLVYSAKARQKLIFTYSYGLMSRLSKHLKNTNTAVSNSSAEIDLLVEVQKINVISSDLDGKPDIHENLPRYVSFVL